MKLWQLLSYLSYVAPKENLAWTIIFSCFFLSFSLLFSPLTERNSKCRVNRKNKCHFLYRLWSRTKFRFSLDLRFLIFLALLPFHEFFMLFFRYLNWSTFATSCCTREPSTLALTRKLRAPLQKSWELSWNVWLERRAHRSHRCTLYRWMQKQPKYLLKIEYFVTF
jgi:hypothetical protein